MNIGLQQVFRPTISFKHGENGERGKLGGGGGNFFWRMHTTLLADYAAATDAHDISNSRSA